ncbi:MAG: Eco57I restriction-modification methylase domain-containing protein, partial [Blastocatellia bacterium]|nr:Eco57I restriction-modification methylase domain-containing protein [Blastocatellia bacterium]
LKRNGAEPRAFDDIGDLLLHADGSLAKHLLQDVLPRLSLLDPACGSGAFLVAAMKTLLGLTTGLIGRCEAVQEKAVLQWIELERKKHKAPLAYWLKKKIITENLFGVDIMEEAVEIAKLRLFLALVASAEKRDQLEPLPNIEFNLMHGNSLIGLLHVNPARYDSKTGAGKAGQERMALVQEPGGGDLAFVVESKTAPTKKETVGAWLAEKRTARYEELLRDKNRLIDQYKKASVDFEDLSALKHSIEERKQRARAILDKLLLDEFVGLGIQFHQATWDVKEDKEGKAERRKLSLDDLRALDPFHWAYEFDEIIVNRGGFDAIITNPPWENFKPDDKEFFMPLAGGISKNKMPLEDFLESKSEVLASDFVLRARYLAYLSHFPHVNLWFRSAPQYENQTAIINGRRATTDLNLYKLFLEQTLHLLHSGGYGGIVIPSGIYSDLGATRLREMLFEKTRITSLFGFENRRQIFENVDSRFKFVVLTFRRGDITVQFPAAFMRHDVKELEAFPHTETLTQSIELIRRLSPDSLSIMEFASPRDVTIASKMAAYPLLLERVANSWNVSLKREFHMKDDNAAGLFESAPGANRLVLLTGKMFHQFRLTSERSGYWVDEQRGRKALAGRDVSPNTRMDYQNYRWVYRRIARSTDTRTLISTIAPKMVFTEVNSPTLDLTQSGISLQEQLFLCAIANSFTLDWYLRLKVSSTLNNFYIYQLPIPRLTNSDMAFKPLVESAARLVGTNVKYDDLLRDVFGPKATHDTFGITDENERLALRAEIDARVAHLYDLTEKEFQHIISTFPLVPETTRVSTAQAYSRLVRKEQVGSL